MDFVHLAQVPPTAKHPDLLAQIGELAFQLGALRSRDVAVVDGVVLPTTQFIQHCQQAAIPAQRSSAAVGAIAAQCQAAIRQIPCDNWLPKVQDSWERSALSYPLVIVRPSFAGRLPIAASDLLTPQIGAVSELETMLKTLWAEVYAARNLDYWAQYCDDLSQIPMATLIQPLRTIQQSGRLWVTATTVVLERFWGVQWLGHPQEIDRPLTVLDRATGQARSVLTHPPIAPPPAQQLVHAILGHWPRALPLALPLITSGNEWLLPHPLSMGMDGAAMPMSPVTDRMGWDLADRLWQELAQPLRVDWQYSHDQLQVQAVYLGELPPMPQLFLDRLRPGAIASPIELRLGGDHGVTPIAHGLAAAPGMGLGRAVVIQSHQALRHELPPESILVTTQLRPEWLPLVRQAAGLVTEQGGMTSHAAVIARTLGLAAIVGVSQATQKIADGDWLRLVDGQVHRLPAAQAIALMATDPVNDRPITQPTDLAIDRATDHATKVQLLVAISHASQVTSAAVNLGDGIGLVRGEHLLAAALAGCSPWQPLRSGDRSRLSQALAGALQPILAAARPVWYRLADWRSHEMPAATGVPVEGHPALGMHGTWFYQQYPDWLGLELAAITGIAPAVRSQLRLLLPFVRTVDEVKFCADALAAAGLGDVPLWIMAEVPAIIYVLPELAAIGVQGMTIGLNDLLQLLFGVDRDQALMAAFFDPSHAVVRSVVRSVLSQWITMAQQCDLACTVCSVPPDAALIEFLVECGVTGIVVNVGDVDWVAGVMAQATG
jgi:pyruvate, water dikinase